MLAADEAKQLTKALEKVEDVAAKKGAMAGIQAARDLHAKIIGVAYGGEDGVRERIELNLLNTLIEGEQLDAARELWEQLIGEWAAHGPAAGQTEWSGLAKAQARLGATIPAGLRDQVRHAWATGVLPSVRVARHPSLAKPPKKPEIAVEQAAAEIAHGEYERARACIAVTRGEYPDAADILEILLMQAQGNANDARDAYRALVQRAAKADYTRWNELVALHIVLGELEPALFEQAIAAWKHLYTSRRLRGRANTAIADS